MSVIYGADGLFYTISQQGAQACADYAAVTVEAAQNVATNLPVIASTALLQLNDLYAMAPQFGFGP